MQNNFSWPSWPFYSEEEIDKVQQVLRSGKVNYWTGGEGRAFEMEFAERFGAKHAVAVMNGTAALEASLRVLNIGPGDEVIVPCRTFFGTASAVVACGATPVMADIELESQNISAKSIGPHITKATKAIVVVHLAGWPCDMDPILDLAEQHGIKIVEDCAQAHGAKYKGKSVGSLGHLGAFSFCQDKIISTGGEGGMVTTNDASLAEKIWSRKDHGKNRQKIAALSGPPGFKYVHDQFGTNLRMTEVQAAIGRIQLRALDTAVAKRRANAQCLKSSLNKASGIQFFEPDSHVFHAYYKCFALLDEKIDRGEVLGKLQKQGVPCAAGDCPNILEETAFQAMSRQPNADFPNAKALEKRSLLFFVHPTLNQNHMEETARLVLESF